jgi:hypothetical protein
MMRRILLETSHIDRESNKVARRIATALGIESDIPFDVKTCALSDLGRLRIIIRDLQKENIILRFLVDNPDFDVQETLDEDRKYLVRYFQNKHSVETLNNRYDYDYFIDHYHPEYIMQLCKILVYECKAHNLDLNEIWTYLISNCGFIDAQFSRAFGPKESDEGTI